MGMCNISDIENTSNLKSNEEKFYEFLESIDCQLIKSKDTIYIFDKHGYLIINLFNELMEKYDDGTFCLVPAQSGDELIKILDNCPKSWDWRGIREKNGEPAIVLSEILPFNLDEVYAIQQRERKKT